MALDPSFVGRCYSAGTTYQVGREKIREFADAIGDGNPVCRDPGAARAAGYADLVAPPTFAIILAMRAQDELLNDPKFGLDYRRMVHGSQSFTHHRPVTAGDELVAALYVDGIRVMGGNDILTLRCEIADSAGDPVTTARAMLVFRGVDS